MPRAADRRSPFRRADVATAEAYVPGGAVLPSAGHAARAFAEAFARLITLAPSPTEVPSLDPAPSWAAWNHTGEGLWPRSEDPDVSLNDVAGSEWLDDAGRCARDRLRAGESEGVIGHCDWFASNLGWSGDELLVVHDWDSVILDSEAVLVGFAAAQYPAVSADQQATVEETERFLVAYFDARGRRVQRRRTRAVVGGWSLDQGLRRQVSARGRTAHHLTVRERSPRAPPSYWGRIRDGIGGPLSDPVQPR